MDNSRLYRFLSDRKTASLSIVALTVMTLYLSSLDSRISSGNDGAFALQTAFTPERFTGIIEAWGLSGISFFYKYLYGDLLFALCYLISFPSLIALMFSQYVLLKKDIIKDDIPTLHYSIRNIFIFLPVIAASANIISDVILLRMVSDGVVHAYMIIFSAVLQTVKMSILIASLCYIVYLLMMRRRLVRAVR